MAAGAPTVLLIQPSSTALDMRKEKPAPPYGLLSAIRLLGEEANVRLLDQRLDMPLDKHLTAALAEKPILVGVTTMAGPMIRHALDITRRVKALAPDTPVLWGGTHALVAGEMAAASPAVDMVCAGEGEQTLLDVVRALKNKTPLASVPNLWIKDDGGKPFLTAAAPFLDLDTLPPVTYRLVGDRYFFPSHGRPTAYIETSRGCPYRCRYCYQSNRKLLWRRASPAWVVRALDHIKNETPDVRHLYFADDNYFYDRDRTITITEEMIRANRDLTYQVQGAALMDLRELSDADLALIARSGCLRMDIGAETGAPEMAKVIGKIVDPGLLLETVGRLSKAGIIPWINFMAGFPGESESDLKHTLDDIESLVRKVPRVMISPVYTFYPYPGTRLFDQSVRHGFKPPATIEEIAGSSWRVPKTPWLSAGKRTFLERLYFYSIFIDGKVPFYSRTFWTRLGHAVMRPLSRLRLRHRFFSLPVEKYLFEAVNGVEY